MLMPSIFGENLLDDFFGEPFGGYDYSEVLLSSQTPVGGIFIIYFCSPSFVLAVI